MVTLRERRQGEHSGPQPGVEVGFVGGECNPEEQGPGSAALEQGAVCEEQQLEE